MRISDWSSDVCSSDLPVVENDARDLAPFARAGAVAQKPSAPELHGVFGILRRGGDDIESRIDLPCARQMSTMCLARVDDGFELGVGQYTERYEDRKSTRLTSTHSCASRMLASA